MKLTFVLNKKYCIGEARYLIKKRYAQNPDAPKLLLPLDLVKKIATREEKNTYKIMDEYYRQSSFIMKKTLTIYQDSWNEINDQFFKTAIIITGNAWRYTNYQCVLSPFVQGISTWKGNKIIRDFWEHPLLMRKITAHELLISLIFTILGKKFTKEKLSHKQIWALTEISAFAITGLEPQMLKFWPWIREDQKYPLNHTYPELYDVQAKLKKKYLKKKSFNEFLAYAIKLVKADEKLK